MTIDGTLNHSKRKNIVAQFQPKNSIIPNLIYLIPFQTQTVTFCVTFCKFLYFRFWHYRLLYMSFCALSAISKSLSMLFLRISKCP